MSMQALLSYDQSPPLAAPLRYFLTAPLFAILAGFLLAWSGPELFVSRWTPAALALTNLITVGFLLQVVLGAMIQILPVVAGANMVNTRLVSALVHAATSAGALVLAAAFVTFSPLLFSIATALLVAGIALFVASAAHALYAIPATSPTIVGLKLSLLGLFATVALGAALTGALAGALDLPIGLPQLAGIHLGWGFVAWATVLLAAVAEVVVPMFQLTPAYPRWFARAFPIAALAVVALWTLIEIFASEFLQGMSGVAVVAVAALFAAVTLSIQWHTKRARFDVTQHYWRVAMVSTLAGCAVWLAAQAFSAVDESTLWPFLFGVLVLFGGFMSVVVGMLYKIVPFLIWLKLQNDGKGRFMAPNMKKIISEKAMRGQMFAHFASCVLLLLTVFRPAVFIYPTAFALILANGWLARNLIAALGVYRKHEKKIEATALSA